MLNIHTDVKGSYSFIVRRPDGSIRDTGVAKESPNLITNAGLDAMGDGSLWLRYCYVGSSGATPSVTDTSMGSFIAYTVGKQDTTSSTSGSAPYYTERVTTYRFAQGVAAGNIAEVGVGWNSTGTGLFSRALIVDEFGNPTTITVLPDETLDVVYTFRLYPKTTDDTGSVTFSGNIGGNFDWIFRPANITSNSSQTGWYVTQSGTSGGDKGNVAVLYTGDIGSITSTPSDKFGSVYNITPRSYVPGSYERIFDYDIGLNDGNNPLGIRSMAMKMGIGYYQIQFDPAIPKTSNDVLKLSVKYSWARRP